MKFAEPINFENRIFQLISLTLLVGLFLNIDVQPVFLEEPRRAIIAMEMMQNGNYFAPTFLGDPYTMKPPVFNWLIVLSMSIFKNPEFALRLPTLLSAIAIAFVLFYIGKKYVSSRFGWILALSFVSSNGILFYFSTLGEIDLFYSLITILTFFSIYHFSVKKQYLTLFVTAYILTSLGFLTKGFPSIIFLLLSLPIPFILKKEFNRLFSWKHLIGILIFVGVIASYFLIYREYMDATKLVDGLWSQSKERTLIDHNLTSIIKHFFFFPLETLLNLIPGILLSIFIFRKSLWSTIKSNDFLKYILLLLLFNFLVYWISPGSRQRYIYMLYPLVLIPGIWFYINHKHVSLHSKILYWIVNSFIVMLVLGAILINFIPEFQFLDYLLLLSVLSGICFLILLWLNVRYKQFTFAWLLLAFAISRIIFDLSFLPQRAYESQALNEKEMAVTIDEIVAENDLYIYKSGNISMTSIYYLNLIRENCLVRSDNLELNTFYVCRNDLLKELPDYKKLLEIDNVGIKYYLVQITKIE